MSLEPALPSSQELQALLANLTSAVQAYSSAPDLDGSMSRAQIIDKSKKISRALIVPDQTPYYHGLNIAELIAIRTFMKLKVLEAIPETGSISLHDLSKATNVQDSLLERMSRVLELSFLILEVGTGFLDQTLADGGDYLHTKQSLAYRNLVPGPGHLFLAMYDEWLKNMHNFDDYLADRGELLAAHEPKDPLKNPYTWTHKQDGTPVWTIMAQDSEKIQTFQTGMAGLDVAIPVTGHFDFSTLKSTPDEQPERIELVDVGGGHGECLRQILEKHSELDSRKCVLQDHPNVIQMAKSSGKLPEGLIAMEHDFNAEQPIKGAKAYFLRMIMHDYADDVCIDILKHLTNSMATDSRVLICDMVLSQRVSEADFASAVMDQAVMSMGGKERTESGFKKLFDSAGLELVKVWRVPGVPGGCVEGRLKG